MQLNTTIDNAQHRTLALPSLKDPRYLQIAVLLAYSIVARELFYMDRPHWVTVVTCITTLTADFLIGYVFFKVIRFPVSSIIVSLAATLLIDSRVWWTYPLVGLLAVISKAVITHKGRHYFNPANFGVALCLLLIPYHTTAIPSLFGGLVIPSLVFAALGFVTILYAKQIAVPLSWLFGFLFFGIARHLYTGINLPICLAPALGASFLIFTFHMISDPQTTPRTTKYRVLFGFLVAAIDAAFRFNSVPYGNFYALFICCALVPFFREYEQNLPAKETISEGSPQH